MKQERIGERSLNIMRNDSLLGRGFVVEEEKGFSIYLHPGVPFWFVPTPLSQEILRLSQITGLAEMFKDRDFSSAWEADVINEDDNLQDDQI